MRRVSFLVIAAIGVLILIGTRSKVRADAVTYAFCNNATHTQENQINDLEVHFNHPVNMIGWLNNGPTSSTQFPNVTGMGTQTLVLSGASLPTNSPGQCSYTFGSGEAGLELDGTPSWTHNNTDVGQPAVIKVN